MKTRKAKFYSGKVASLAVFFVFLLNFTSVFAEDRSIKPVLYVNGTSSGIVSLRKNVELGDIVAPQSYAFSKTGKLSGAVKPEILSISRNAGADIMPLVVNEQFSQKSIHEFLKDEVAQEKLIKSLVNEAKEKNFIGFQYDIEHMPYYDKEKYSNFVTKSAPAFHEAGLILSVAVGPKHSDFAEDYGKGSWENWTGAFDYEAIGKAADFVSVMAYDDSKSVGPTASISWVREVVDYSVSKIPPEKISLAVPFYAWTKSLMTGKRVDITTYPKIEKQLYRKNINQGYSKTLGTSYVTYYKDNNVLVTWYEDKNSFSEKLDLVKEYNLHGFSAWALGQEDPKVWELIHPRNDDLAYNAGKTL